MQVQLQPLDHVRKISSVETHHVFGYARRLGGAVGAEEVEEGRVINK